MRAYVKVFRRDGQLGRHDTVMAVLVAFALVVAVVTLLVLTAIGRVAEYANYLDNMRSQETASGALNTFRSQLSATLDDYAAWDDAAAYVYRANDRAWMLSNYGDVTHGSELFDVAAVFDADHKTLLAYRDGKPLTVSGLDFFGPDLLTLLENVEAMGRDSPRQTTGFMRTQDGIAAVGVALIRPENHKLAVPKPQRRYLVLARHLDEEHIRQLAGTYVIEGLQFSAPDADRGYSVSIDDPFGVPLARLVWRSRAPGDASYAQARPLVLEALGLVGLFFVVLIAVGWLAGRRLKAEEAAARHAMLHDRLSGLLNREGMRIGVDALLEKAGEEGNKVLLVYLDLDGFKEINDSYGHESGDHVICAVSAGLRVLLPDDAILGRLGGDEFAIAFCGETAGEARRLAEDVIAFLSEPLEIGRRLMVVGASAGIAVSSGGKVSREELLRRADLAMYKAKEEGGSRAVLYESVMDANRELRNALELDLAKAVDEGSLTVAYQPVVGAQSSMTTGVEALARWNRPGHGPVPPDVFIPIAETSGLIEALGLFVLRKACESARAWPGIRVAVNVSPGQFRNPAFADHVRALLKETGMEPQRVTLEITEGYIVQNPERMRQAIERLKAIGVNIALDDFGSGFSSIGYLRQFGFDRLKIDKSLLADIVDNRAARDMLQATVALARSLDIPVTAEGIETSEQGRAARDMGCDELQGYFFGRPVSEDEIARRLLAEADDWGAVGAA